MRDEEAPELELEFPTDAPERRFASARQAFSAWLGVATAIVILFGVGYWLYSLGMRQPDNIPVIAASTTPAKQRPAEDEVEAVTPYQDMASYEAGAPTAETGEEPIELAPPPLRPGETEVALSELEDILGVTDATAEDAVGESAEPLAEPRGATVDSAKTPESTEPAAVAGTEGASTAPDPVVPVERAEARAPGTLGDAETAGTTGAMRIETPRLTLPPPPEPETAAAAAPTGETASEPGPAEAAPDPAPAETAETEQGDTAVAAPTPPAGTGSPQAPALSPLVPRRPADLRQRMAAAGRDAEQEVVALSERAAASRFQIQLGAFASPSITRRQWARAAAAHPELLRDRALVVQPVRSGGATLYRLRVGPFSTRAEANSICQALRARGQDCLVARNG